MDEPFLNDLLYIYQNLIFFSTNRHTTNNEKLSLSLSLSRKKV